MSSRAVPVVALALFAAACRQAPAVPAPLPPVALRPTPVTLEKAYHAMNCGAVTAVWSGSAEALATLGPSMPKQYGVESLEFRFSGSGARRGFVPVGQLFFSDWSFDVFSPDCSHVALLVDHYGPVHIVKTAELEGYLQGRVKPQVVAPKEADARVFGQLAWASADTLEFVTSCCGGATVWRAQGGSLTQVLDAPKAPGGVHHTDAGWEVSP